MSRKDKVQSLIQQLSGEIYEFIKENESLVKDGWVPTATIKKKLELNFVCVPESLISNMDQKGGYLQHWQEF